MPSLSARQAMRTELDRMSTYKLQCALQAARRDTGYLICDLANGEEDASQAEGLFAFSFLERGQYKAALRRRGASVPPLSAIFL